MKFETRAICVGDKPKFKEGGCGDVIFPIHLSTTFAREHVDVPTRGYEYSRTGNPTREALECKLASLENAENALTFASGMAAEATIMLGFLKSGDHVIAFDDLYGGTKRLFNTIFKNQYNIDFSFVDMRNTENVTSAIRENTKMIWMESPTNPLLKICDIGVVSEIAREKNILTVVDNTFMSPFFQKPLELGADISVYSTTKYLNGHSDSIGGAVMVNDDKLFEILKFNQNNIGAILSPFDCFLVMRGLKTLSIRMERHNENAIKIAEYLESHSKVKKVYYPGLKTHELYEVGLKQTTGFGGMISFELDGNLEDAKKFLSQLSIFSLAESLGGVESLIEHPAIMTHASVAKEEREKIGISDSLIRISVGIENISYLLDVLDYAFCSIDY